MDIINCTQTTNDFNALMHHEQLALCRDNTVVDFKVIFMLQNSTN